VTVPGDVTSDDGVTEDEDEEEIELEKEEESAAGVPHSERGPQPIVSEENLEESEEDEREDRGEVDVASGWKAYVWSGFRERPLMWWSIFGCVILACVSVPIVLIVVFCIKPKRDGDETRQPLTSPQEEANAVGEDQEEGGGG